MTTKATAAISFIFVTKTVVTEAAIAIFVGPAIAIFASEAAIRAGTAAEAFSTDADESATVPQTIPGILQVCADSFDRIL